MFPLLYIGATTFDSNILHVVVNTVVTCILQDSAIQGSSDVCNVYNRCVFYTLNQMLVILIIVTCFHPKEGVNAVLGWYLEVVTLPARGPMHIEHYVKEFNLWIDLVKNILIMNMDKGLFSVVNG